MVSKNNLCSNSLKGLLGQLRISKIEKLNSSLSIAQGVI